MKPITEASFKVPGKTFLAGEYAVLLGGPALGIATTPCFEFSFNESLPATVFHKDSPAGRYIERHLNQDKISFKDSYAEIGITGGFGRSTAEYLASITPELVKNKKGVFEILKEYRALHADQKVPPSGLDLVFQYLGGVTLADQQMQMFQNFDWNFLNLDFALIYSGIKIKTHEHLAGLNLETLESLPALSAEICSLYAKNNESEFLYQMKEWCELLKSKYLTHPHSLEIRSALESSEIVKLVKPCGALGADVLMVFYDRVDKEQIRRLLKEKNYKFVADSGDLSAGLVSQLRPYWSQNVG